MSLVVPRSEGRLTDKKNRLMTFAGAGHGCWGETPDEVQKSISELRDSWWLASRQFQFNQETSGCLCASASVPCDLVGGGEA